MPFILSRVLTIIHYLGWAGVLIGVALFIVGNRERGTELMISGVSFIAAKYIVALVFVLLFKSAGKGKSAG
jgi:hydrogenase-4 membrane subunit HyfE